MKWDKPGELFEAVLWFQVLQENVHRQNQDSKIVKTMQFLALQNVDMQPTECVFYSYN